MTINKKFKKWSEDLEKMIDKIKRKYEKEIAEIENSSKEDILNQPLLIKKRDELNNEYDEKLKKCSQSLKDIFKI